MSRSRFWCFTLNNPSDEEEKDVVGCHPEVATYLCYGREVGEGGTPHLQGYVEFCTRIRLTAAKKVPGFERAHLEPRKGSQDQAIRYCGKDGTLFEHGVKCESHQGKRCDLDEVRKSIDEGLHEIAIAENHFGAWVRYRESFAAYKRLKAAKESRKVTVTFLWGLPGTGKTRGVFETYPDVWISSDPTLTWFDGYDGQDVVLLDDYRGGAADSLILRLLDRYPLNVAIKGGFRTWQATRIFITSNADPRTLHASVSAAWLRRIDGIFHLQGNLYADGAEASLARYLEFLKPPAAVEGVDEKGDDEEGAQ